MQFVVAYLKPASAHTSDSIKQKTFQLNIMNKNCIMMYKLTDLLG